MSLLASVRSLWIALAHHDSECVWRGVFRAKDLHVLLLWVDANITFLWHRLRMLPHSTARMFKVSTRGSEADLLQADEKPRERSYKSSFYFIKHAETTSLQRTDCKCLKGSKQTSINDQSTLEWPDRVLIQL